MILCRYGEETGSFTAEKGTPYELLGLPYNKESVEYHEYEVVGDNLRVRCVVIKGMVAPAFSSQGGVTQYKHSKRIIQEIADGKLLEVFLWRN